MRYGEVHWLKDREAKKWKKKNLDLQEDGHISLRSQKKGDTAETFDLEKCMVETIDDDAFVKKHKKQFKGTEQFYFAIRDTEEDTELVLCVENENDFKGWMQILQKRCGNQPDED